MNMYVIKYNKGLNIKYRDLKLTYQIFQRPLPETDFLIEIRVLPNFSITILSLDSGAPVGMSTWGRVHTILWQLP